jgi:hypothetical protein
VLASPADVHHRRRSGALRVKRQAKEDKYMHVEYWEKEGADDEGVWAFLAVDAEGPKDGQVEEKVWGKVCHTEDIGWPKWS